MRGTEGSCSICCTLSPLSPFQVRHEFVSVYRLFLQPYDDIYAIDIYPRNDSVNGAVYVQTNNLVVWVSTTSNYTVTGVQVAYGVSATGNGVPVRVIVPSMQGLQFITIGVSDTTTVRLLAIAEVSPQRNREAALVWPAAELVERLCWCPAF